MIQTDIRRHSPGAGHFLRRSLLPRILTVLLSFMTAFSLPAQGIYAEEQAGTDPLTNHIERWPQMGAINEASGIVMDADNGGILYSLNRDTMRYPASTTKILTALIVLENAGLGDTLTVSGVGQEEILNGSTNAGTIPGETFTVEQCLYVLLLKSANDIADELAVHVAGSIEAFAEMMNQKAAEIGCTNTHFKNPSGMPDSEHYSTAYDMALIMQACLKNETFRKIIATQKYTVPATNKMSEERVYYNHCKLVLEGDEYYYRYCIGGKTGFTKAAWRTLVTAAEKDGRTLICVVMRGPDSTDFADTARLFDYGFDQFTKVSVPDGSVNLPSGISTDELTETETEEGDGSVLRRYFWQDLPVGSARSEPETLAASTVSVSAAIEELAGTVREDGAFAGFNGLQILLIAVALLVGAAAVVVALGFLKATGLFTPPKGGKRKKH